MQLHMVYLHNNAIVQGKPRYEIKLNNLKLSMSDEQYITKRFKILKHKKNDNQCDATSKAITNIMLVHRKANKWDSKCNSAS